MKLVKRSDIRIASNRQRREITPNEVIELMDSIASVGLLHPPVVRADPEQAGYLLVAGERRLRAIEYLEGQGGIFTHSGRVVPTDQIPVTDLGELDGLGAFEAELEENIRRIDLSWQDKSLASAQLVELRQLQADKRGDAFVEPATVAKEIYPDHSEGQAKNKVRQDVIVTKFLNDPDVSKAPDLKSAMKIIKRKEEAAKSAELGRSVGASYNASVHKLILTDAITWLAACPKESFDVILTDPPYGIDAQDFGDSGGVASGAAHRYRDDYDHFKALITDFAPLSYMVCKPQAHLYLFCDISNFDLLKFHFERAGWECFRTPLIWHNPSSQRAPWPQHGPHRRYQTCLYAMKGKRNVLKLSSDLVTFPSDPNLGWQAQKPVDLYVDYLTRSCRPGDSVLDPFCGSGPIFPAAHRLKLRATGIERDEVAYGISVKRLGELK